MPVKPMLLLSLICCLFNSCGLSKYGIKEAWVFTEEKFRGTIQVDDNGNPVTKGVMVETTIFLETETKDLPVWTTAEIDGKTYSIKENIQVQSPSTIGKNKTDETPVTITASTGHFLYRLTLESFDPSEHTSAINNIRLTGNSAEGSTSVRVKRKAIPLLPQMIP